MSLPQSTDVSSSTLALPGPDLPFLHPLSPPPHREIESYGKRALPPVPLNRYSCVSAFSKEVDEALATPEPVAASDQGSIYLVYRRDAESDAGGAEIFDRPGKRASKKRGDLKVNTAGVLRAALDTLRSPQPQPRSSVQKVQKLSGLPNAPAFRETTPTGHNPGKKVHRLMGLGVPPGSRNGKGKSGQRRRNSYTARCRPRSRPSATTAASTVMRIPGLPSRIWTARRRWMTVHRHGRASSTP